MRIAHRFVVAGLFAAAGALAQPTSDSPLAPPPNGPRHSDPTFYVLTGATIHPSPGQTIEDGFVAFRDGRILGVGQGDGEAFIDDGARRWDCDGLHIYPGLIEPFLEVDAPAPTADDATLHWNDGVIPQRHATDGDGAAEKDAGTLRDMGFVAAGISPSGGIIRGQAGVVSLAEALPDDSDGEVPIYRDGVYQTVSFATGGWGSRGYPNSEMGAIALIRQCLSDAAWQAEQDDDLPPNALDALAEDRPLLFTTRDELEALRSAKIAAEFDREAMLVGSGREYRRLDAIVEDGLPIILPIEFPEAPDVASLGAEDALELETLQHWEQAPYNPRRLDEAGVTVALTTSGMRNRSKFMDRLRDAIERGLAEDSALTMLTTTPAELLGIDDVLGSIERGKVASVVVADGPLFAKDTKVREVWIDGRRHEINAAPDEDITGRWKVTFNVPQGMDPSHADGPEIEIKKGDKITVKHGDEEPVKARNVKRIGNRINYVVDIEKQAMLVSAIVDGDQMIGVVRTPEGGDFSWSATRIEDQPDDKGKDENEADPVVGHWDLVAHNEQMFGAQGVSFAIDVKRKDDALDVSFDSPPVEADVVDASFDDGVLTVNLKDSNSEERYTLTLKVDGDAAEGEATFFKGEEASKVEGTRVASKDDDEDLTIMPNLVGLPCGPYALDEQPAQRTVVFKNATIWTSGPDGILENGWMVIEGGKIVAVGDGPLDVMTSNDAEIIDCEGKDITPGIIDCHSHTGISRGVNESGQAVTAEVRISDVTDPDEINWYRQLAGGVTTVNSLHGSANPIGGQNQVNKLRWGAARPDDMHFEGAPPGIKFALGENVKQSNWSNAGDRYPQTRMGVETLIRDRLIAAREYAASIDAGENVRRDLELEALAEILAHERLIHCHSYRQDEILMLCNVADEFGFKIGSFQHVLEGYKVAEAIKKSAFGGSTFSDWWAYKVEVQDAIPYNGAIMHDVGVVVSFNSDSDELARRLNTEAAKAVRYGGLDEAEALKFVTINPAIQLGVSDKVGSLEAGKDADIAIWSGNPLSTFSRCESTWVDGREYFSLEKDAQLRQRDSAERTRLIQKILAEGRKDKPEQREGSESDRPGAEPVRFGRPQLMSAAEWEEQQMLEELREHNLELLRRGLDPSNHVCGECGTTLTDLLSNEH